MSINLVAYSPIEAEVFAKSVNLQTTVGIISDTIFEADPDAELEILFVLNSEEMPVEELTLAFSGTNLSMEFTLNKVDITYFDETDGSILLKSFPLSELSVATEWLMNYANQ